MRVSEVARGGLHRQQENRLPWARARGDALVQRDATRRPVLGDVDPYEANPDEGEVGLAVVAARAIGTTASREMPASTRAKTSFKVR